MEYKHEPYWSKMQVNIEEFENFDKYAFYVRIGPPTEKYEDTPIFYQTVCVTRPTPPELIDHIFNDGAAHRKLMRSGKFYQWLIKNGATDRFRTLCHNCNQGRRINGGTCPHGNGI